MLRFAWLKVTILSCLLTLSGCLGENSGDTTCIKQTDPEGTILVSIGCGSPRTRPFYLWDDLEGVGAVEVSRTADDEVVVWSVIDIDIDDSIEQPVQHGDLPSGAFIGEDDETELEFGIEYLVKVSRFSGGSGTRVFVILPEE
jgi:hypothetical protein